MATKDSFVFRKEWRDAISGLPDDVRLEIYEAIVGYGISGDIPNLKPMARLAFNFAKATLDADAESYERICERNRKNGKNGGRPKLNPVGFLETQDNPNNRVGFLETQKSGGFLERETEQGKESPVVSPTPPSLPKEKEEEKERVSLDFSEQKFADPQILFDKRKAKFVESIEPFVATFGKEMTDEFISYWTEPNKSHTKMRYELERTWDTNRRLRYWASRKWNSSCQPANSQKEEQARAAREERERKTEDLLRQREMWQTQAVSREEAMKSEEYRRAMEGN